MYRKGPGLLRAPIVGRMFWRLDPGAAIPESVGSTIAVLEIAGTPVPTTLGGLESVLHFTHWIHSLPSGNPDFWEYSMESCIPEPDPITLNSANLFCSHNPLTHK